MNKIKFPELMETKRLLLKKHTFEHAEVMFNYVDRDRDRLRRFLPWVDFTKTIEDEISYVKMSLEKWDSYELFGFGIFHKFDNIYLGNIGIHSISWENDRCEFGYWILGDFEGQGFMSEAVIGLERAAFELGFNRIEIRCSSSNTRSASIPKRLGYSLDGVLRQEAIEQGQYRDTFVFSKLRCEVK